MQIWLTEKQRIQNLHFYLSMKFLWKEFNSNFHTRKQIEFKFSDNKFFMCAVIATKIATVLWFGINYLTYSRQAISSLWDGKSVNFLIRNVIRTIFKKTQFLMVSRPRKTLEIHMWTSTGPVYIPACGLFVK